MPDFAAPVFWQSITWLFVATTIVQWVVWCFVFGKLALKKTPLTKPQSTNQAVSVILCARNEADNLRRNLPVILAQQFDCEWELVVVDDASEDDTPEVLRAFQENNPTRLRVVRIPEKRRPGKKHALAQGIALAKHDLLLLTDADCRPVGPNWVAHMAACFSAQPETEIVLGYGPTNPIHGVWGAWTRYETAYTAAQYCALAVVGMPYMGVGRNLAFRRQVYERVGGFAAHAGLVSGDDDLLVNATATGKNTLVCLDSESFMYSAPSPNFLVWLRQKRRHLSASPAYRWPHKLVLTILAGTHVGHYFLFLLLLMAGWVTPIVLLVFLLRLMLVWVVFGKILHRLRERGLFFKIPVFDALLAAYFGVIVPWFLLNKKTQLWK